MPIPKDNSKAIICEHNKTSTLEEIAHKLVGSTTHSK